MLKSNIGLTFNGPEIGSSILLGGRYDNVYAYLGIQSPHRTKRIIWLLAMTGMVAGVTELYDKYLPHIFDKEGSVNPDEQIEAIEALPEENRPTASYIMRYLHETLQDKMFPEGLVGLGIEMQINPPNDVGQIIARRYFTISLLNEISEDEYVDLSIKYLQEEFSKGKEDARLIGATETVTELEKQLLRADYQFMKAIAGTKSYKKMVSELLENNSFDNFENRGAIPDLADSKNRRNKNPFEEAFGGLQDGDHSEDFGAVLERLAASIGKNKPKNSGQEDKESNN